MARGQEGFNYGVLIEVAKSNELTNFDDILYLAGQIDNELYIKHKNNTKVK